jgi:hypothetical protein
LRGKGYSARYFWFFAGLVLCAAIPALSGPAAVDPSSFHTNANFSVDNDAMSLSTAVATIEPRLGAPGYSWLRVSFYSFPVTADDLAGILKGDTGSMDKKHNMKASNPKDYNNSYAMIQLSVDKDFKVWQVDMSVPGHGCTIAPYEKDVATFLQDYQLDGKNLRLKSKGSYVCDMKFMGIPNQKFGWEIDLRTEVFQKVK